MGKAAKIAWILFDWAAQPYFTLIATFIFPPFFVTAIINDPIRGQTLWGMTTAFAALLVACLAPIIGSLCDRAGRILPFFLVSCGVGASGASLIWWCVPGEPYSVLAAIVAMTAATVGFEIATSTNNAMLTRVAQRDALTSTAWAGWTVGGASGTVTLLLFIVFFMPGEGGLTVLGSRPFFGFLDTSADGARFTGPFAALWLLIFILPIAAFYKEGAQHEPSDSHRNGPNRPIGSRKRFLLANLLLSDALVALFAFGGIYAAVIFGWGTEKLVMLGLALTISGFIGPLLGVWINRSATTEKDAAFACIVIIACGLFILGLSPDAVFVWPSKPLVGGFTQAEALFALSSFIIGVASSYLQSALRVMFLDHVEQKDSGRLFGFFALSGKSTTFIGPLLVAGTMSFFQSTKAGMFIILLIFAAGLSLLQKAGRRAR